MAPSTTIGATILLCRKAATKVIVSHSPHGARPINSMPRGLRPQSRTILVATAVSSMNTSRAGSSMPCSRIQRRRARATSARCCYAARRLFFIGDLASIEEPPHCTTATRDPLLAHRRDNLVQRQIRLLGDESQQPFHLLLQRRGAAAAWLCCNTPRFFPSLRPNHHNAAAYLIDSSRLTPRGAGLDGLDHSCP